MKNFGRFTLCTVAVMLFVILPLRLVWSADENASVAQVYLEFDPATGQFVSVPATAENSPDGAAGMGGSTAPHSATATPDAAGAASATGTAAVTAAPQSQATADGTAAVDGAAPGAGGISPVLIGAVVLIALGGIVMMMRKKTA